jgi:hypothetical protein
VFAAGSDLGEVSGSFLKKRIKKLLRPLRTPPDKTATAPKSLLLLFFRKEVLSFVF